jgi:hypothetical protein
MLHIWVTFCAPKYAVTIHGLLCVFFESGLMQIFWIFILSLNVDILDFHIELSCI